MTEIVTEDKKKKHGLEKFEEKYHPNFAIEREAYQAILKKYRDGDVTYV